MSRTSISSCLRYPHGLGAAVGRRGYNNEKGKKPKWFLEVPQARLVGEVGVSMGFVQCVFLPFFLLMGRQDCFM